MAPPTVSKPLAHELDAAWIIALWIAIHGGDPADDVSAVAGTIIANLATFAFGNASELPVEELQSRLGALNVHVGGNSSGGVQADYHLVPGSGDGPVIEIVTPWGILRIPKQTRF